MSGTVAAYRSYDPKNAPSGSYLSLSDAPLAVDHSDCEVLSDSHSEDLNLSQSGVTIDIPISDVFDDLSEPISGASEPGTVASDEEVSFVQHSNWSDIPPHLFKNIRRFIPSSFLDEFSPGNANVKQLVENLVSRSVAQPAFGGKERTQVCLALLLGRISDLNRLDSALQLEENFGVHQVLRGR